MKQFTMTVKNCSHCPNSYVHGTEDSGGRYYRCRLIKKVVGIIDGAKYDEEKDKFDYEDNIPDDCPLPNAL